MKKLPRESAREWKKLTKRLPPRVLLWKSFEGYGKFKARSFYRANMDIGDGVYVNIYVKSPVKEIECIEIQMHYDDVMWLSQKMKEAWERTTSGRKVVVSGIELGIHNYGDRGKE